MSIATPPPLTRPRPAEMNSLRLATVETAADNLETTAAKGWEPNPVSMVRFEDHTGCGDEEGRNGNVVSRVFNYIHLLTIDTLQPAGIDGTPTETVIIQFSTGEVRVQGRRLNYLVDGLQQQRLSIVASCDNRYASQLPMNQPVILSLLFVTPPQEEE